MPDLPNPKDRERSRSQRALRAMRSHVRPGSFPLLLAATLLVYVLNGLAVASIAGRILVLGAEVCVVGAGLYVLSANRVTLRLGVLVIGLQLTFRARLWGLELAVNRMLQDAIVIAFLLWVLVIVLREVFRASTTERDAVVGALCGFLLILMMFLRLHALLDVLDPASYQTNGAPFAALSDMGRIAVFQYFSTVTLTTVGFGDIVPVTAVARLVTGLEAMVGQLYLAVVIATLVGRVAARRE